MIHYYQCEYCYQAYREEEKTVAHELECLKNPIKKSCYTCRFAISGGCLIYRDPHFRRDCEKYIQKPPPILTMERKFKKKKP